jgi:hypothetical protein
VLPVTAGEHTVKLRAKKDSGIESASIGSIGTHYTYDLVPQ